MRKISVIFGTRPEAIKLAPVILALRERTDVDLRVCVTGQHRHMLDQVLEVFGIVPDIDLKLMRPDQTLAGLTSRAIEAIDGVFAEDRPDLVLAQGDTTTVLCAALAAFYRKIPVGHVEAGLRTGNIWSPWPEEANRLLTTRLARWHFAPTETSRENLLREGVPAENVYVTGNTVIDALLIAREKTQRDPPAIPGLEALASRTEAPIVLITGHRRENFGEGFDSICRAIAELARKFPETQFVYPVHLNPNVREPVERILRPSEASNIHLIEPLSYLPFVALMDRCKLILTDSGGVQEEAPSLGKPVLVMRETTERPEGVAAGTVLLVGSDFEKIVASTSRLLTDPAYYASQVKRHNPYGDGNASRRIVDVCTAELEPGRTTP